MIQEHIKNKLAAALPSLIWSIDYKVADDNTATVYAEGGSKPGEYDVPNRYPRYMVYISSSDWGFAEFAAEKVFELIHKLRDEEATINYYKDEKIIETKKVYIQMIRASGDINPLGVENNVMDYSVNFEASLIEMKE